MAGNTWGASAGPNGQSGTYTGGGAGVFTPFNGSILGVPDFDIDRLGIGGTSFSTGSTGTSDFANGAAVIAGNAAVRYGTDRRGALGNSLAGTGPQSTALPNPGTQIVTGANNEGRVLATLGLSFTLRPRNLIEASKGFQSFPDFTIKLDVVDGNGDPYTFNMGSTVNPVGFRLGTARALFKGIGGAPLLSFDFGVNPAFKFTNYAFNNSGGRGDGFVAYSDGRGIGIPGNLTIVYGSRNNRMAAAGGALVTVYTSGTPASLVLFNKFEEYTNNTAVINLAPAAIPGGRNTVVIDFADGSQQVFVVTATTGDFTVTGSDQISQIRTITNTGSDTGANGDNVYYGGVRGEMSLIPGFKGGIYFGYENRGITVFGLGSVQGTPNGSTSYVGAGTPTYIYGLDWATTAPLFGLLNINGEYNVSDPYGLDLLGPDGQIAAYTQISAKLDPFTIGFNYRVLDSGYNGFSRTGSGPYATNTWGLGFSIAASKLFGLVDFNVYYDTRGKRNPGATLGGGPAFGSYNPDGTVDVGTNGGAAQIQETDFGIGFGLDLGIVALKGGYANEYEWNGARNRGGFGLEATSAGKLIPGLNLAAGFTTKFDNTVTSNSSVIYAYADFGLDLAGFKVTPKVYFASRDNNGATFGIVDTTQVGVSVDASGPISFLFGAKAALGFAYDSATVTNPSVNASTLWISLGLTWDQGALPNSSFSLAFATRTDTNRNGTKFGPSFSAPIALGAWGDVTNGVSTNLYGFYTTFTYWGLGFKYGIFAQTNLLGGVGGAIDPVRWGNSFTIDYALKF